MQHEAFYRRHGEQFIPNPMSAGPWKADSLMGRVVVGLLGHVIGERHLKPGYVPARMTVELHSLPDFSPVTIQTRVIREGGRITIVEAEYISGTRSVAMVRCQLLRQTEPPAGRVWVPQDWDAPAPDDVPVPERYANWKWDLRPFAGTVGHFGPKRAWLRDYRQLVEGVSHTPFSRMALATDFVSPFSHVGDEGAGYINTDVSLYLHRLPVEEWIGFEVEDHQASAGIAVGHCRIYDQQGPIGFGSAAALAQRRAQIDNPLAGGSAGS